MKQKASLFNTALFLNMNRRCWPLWVVYGLFLLLVLVLPLSFENFVFGPEMIYLDLTPVWYSIFLPFAPAYIAFKHMNSQKSAIFYGSLPLKCRSIFCTMLLAGYLPLLLLNLFALVVAIPFCLMGIVYMLPALLAWFAMLSLLELVFFSIAVLCMQLTSVGWVAGALYVGFNGIAVAARSLLESFMSQFLYGLSYGSLSVLEWLSPWFLFFNECSIAVDGGVLSADGWLVLGIYGVLALGLLALSLLLYNRRPLERSSDFLVFNGFKIVFKYLTGVFCAFAFGLFLEGIVGGFFCSSEPTLLDSILLVVFMTCGALIGFIGASMFVKKHVRIASRDLLGFGVVSALCACAVFGCYFDVLGIETKVPDASRVKSVVITDSSYSYEMGDLYCVLDDEEGIALATEFHQALLADWKADKISDSYAYASRDYDSMSESSQIGSGICIDYTLSSGLHLVRHYDVYCSERALEDAESCVSKLEDVCNCKDARESRLEWARELVASADDKSCMCDYLVQEPGSPEPETRYSLDLSKAEAEELVNGPMAKDVEEAQGCKVDVAAILGAETKFGSLMGSSFEVFLSEGSQSYSYGQLIIDVPKKGMPSTYSWLKKLAADQGERA